VDAVRGQKAASHCLEALALAHDLLPDQCSRSRSSFSLGTRTLPGALQSPRTKRFSLLKTTGASGATSNWSARTRKLRGNTPSSALTLREKIPQQKVNTK
jgi:hypothetical protein